MKVMLDQYPWWWVVDLVHWRDRVQFNRCHIFTITDSGEYDGWRW